MDAIAATTVMECSMQGSALLGGVNVLHSAFPENADAEYSQQGKVMNKVSKKLDRFLAVTDVSPFLEKLILNQLGLTHLLTAASTTGGASIGDVSREVLSPSLSPQLNDTHSKTGGSISPHGKENQNGSQLKETRGPPPANGGQSSWY